MKHILLTAALALPALSYAQDGKRYALKGVVTYYFNANYGDRPDAGAKAYVMKPDTASKYGLGMSVYYHYKLLAIKSSGAGLLIKPEKRLTAEEKNVKAELSASADSLLRKQFFLEHRVPYVTADGNGVFNKNLAPGKYVVFVKSSHRKGLTAADVDGYFFMKEIEVKDDDVEVPVKFGLYN